MDSVFRIGRGGVVFKPESGKLYLFKPHSVCVLVGWPRPMAWRKTKKQPCWRAYRPKLDNIPISIASELAAMLNLPGEIHKWHVKECLADEKQRWAHDAWLRERTHWLQLFERIPPDIRLLIAPYQDRHWHLLAFLARCGTPAQELVRSNPALAYALASNWVFHKPVVTQPLRAARALLKRPQREALAWLGFPKSESARRILCKIPPGAVSTFLLLYLRRVMVHKSIARRLSHLPRVNVGVVRIITDPRFGMRTPARFLDEVALSVDNDQRTSALDDLELMQSRVDQIPGFSGKFALPTSLTDMEKAKDALLATTMALTAGENRPFPAPPIPGTDAIVPLRTMREVVEEGIAQQHCLATGAPRDTGRMSYFYKVLRPERCTVQIVFRGGVWRMQELRGAANTSVSAETRRAVEAWLHECGGRHLP